MSDETRDGDEPTEDELPETEPEAAEDEPGESEDGAEESDEETEDEPDEESEDEPEAESGDEPEAESGDEPEAESGDEPDEDSEDESDDAGAAKEKKSGPPPRPGKNRDQRARSKDRARRSRGGGKRARRRRLRRPVSLALAIVSLLGVVGLTAWFGIRANDGEEASFWTYAAGTAVGLTAVACVTWSLSTRSLRNRGIGALVFVVTLAVVSLTAVTTTDTSPQLGLDLQGGFSVVLSAKGDPKDDSVDQAMEIIRNRIDGLGVAEPEVTRQGDNVVVDLPGIEDRERAQEILGETARLEFRPVLFSQLPYDAEAAAAGEDPCAAGVAALQEQQATASTIPGETVPGETVPGETVPGETVPGETVPGDTTAPADTTATTAPTSTEAPASTDEQEGAGPTPAPSGGEVSDGEQAAPSLRRQEDTTTTTTPPTTAPGDTATTAPGDTATTAPADTATTVPVDTTPTTTTPAEAADPAALAGATIAVPNRPVAGEEPVSCTQLGPVGFEGGSLSKAQAQLGGNTGSEWVVAVRVKGGDQAQANELINACAAGAANCPADPITQSTAGQMAIVLDGEVISAPTVNGPDLASDEFVITGGAQGGFPEADAKDLALKLRYGALPVEFTRSAERQISATLGEDSLRAGVLAGIIGLIAVALYLLMYYRALGLVVVAGIAVWGSLMYGVICWLSASRGLTLSLSGVVGIVISLGTTVDSYIVYFERLKDEVRLGKSVRASTDRGFQKAFRTILTADVASLMGAVLLWWLTVGAVRGFAFFLGLSVVLDILVAYCFSRPVVSLLARNHFFTENRIFGVARGLGRSDGGGRTPRKTRAGASA